MSASAEPIESAQAAPEAQSAPNVKVIIGGGKAGAPKVKKVEGETLLAAMAGDTAGVWLVRRDASETGGQPGMLPVRLYSTDMDPLIIDNKLGEGSYTFISKSDPSKTMPYINGSTTPAKNFGTPDAEPEWGVMPNGQPVIMPRAPRQAQFYAPPQAYQQQGGWAQPVPQTDPALKLMLEAMMKTLEKLAEKKPDGPSADMLLKIEQMKSDARVAEAKEARLAREAELKAKEIELRERATLEREIARETSKATAEAARCNADAARAQAEAFQKAQAESARANIEAAKESAKAQIEAAREAAKMAAETSKERAASEKSMLDRYIAMQERVHKEAPEPADPFETWERVERILEKKRPPESLVGQITTGAQSILDRLIALRSMQQPAAPPAAPQVTATNLGPAQPPPNGTLPPAAAAAMLAGGAPEAAKPAPPTPDPAAEAAQREARALAAQFMNGLETLIDGSRREPPTDPMKMAAVLKAGAPRVYEWLRDSKDILADMGAVLASPAFTAAEREKALAARGALADKLTWMASVVGAVKA